MAVLTLKERLIDYGHNPSKYSMLNTSFIYSGLVLLALIIVQAMAYLAFFSSIPNFLPRYAIWLFYLDISIASLGGSIWFMSSYKARIPCMTGMMLGMTLGMQTGMMLGASIGATNGFFVGAMAGMLIGTLAGTLAGASSGNMGALQGMMSGVMGGTMGAMITVMMYSDNVHIFMPFYMAINVAIVAGNSLMYHEEIVEPGKSQEVKIEGAVLVSSAILIGMLLTFIMVYGPKSSLFV